MSTAEVPKSQLPGGLDAPISDAPLSVSSDKEPLLTRHQLWWLAFLLIICVPGVIVAGNYKESLGSYMPETLPMPSTYNKKPSGYSALYELLQKVGVKEHRWQSPYRDLLKSDVHGTLVIISPFESPAAADIVTLRTWVEAGNSLVYADLFTMGVGDSFLHQFELADKAQFFKNKPVSINEEIPERRYVDRLVISGESVLDGGTPVAGSAHEAALTEVKAGNGRCLFITAPVMCANSRIADPTYKQNFQFMVNWLSHSPQPIWFDERSHGFSSADNAVMVLFRGPVGFLTLQLLIILVVACLSLNQRFGAPLKVVGDRKLSNLEFIDGLAWTYRRARARDTVWAMLFTPFKARMCKSLGVAPHESNAQIAAGYAEAINGSADSCLTFLDAADDALKRRHLSEEDLVGLTQRGDDLAAKAPQLQSSKRVMGA